MILSRTLFARHHGQPVDVLCLQIAPEAVNAAFCIRLEYRIRQIFEDFNQRILISVKFGIGDSLKHRWMEQVIKDSLLGR